MLPSVTPSINALTDLVLEPVIALDDYVPADSMKSAPNVFFIMLESISWDHFGLFIEVLPIRVLDDKNGSGLGQQVF